MSYHKFAKDVGIVSISELLIRVKPLLFLPILTKALGTSDYGIYCSFLVTMALCGVMSTFNLGVALQRFLPSQSKENKAIHFSSAFYTIFLFSMIISAILYLSSGLLASTVFGDSNSVVIIQLAAILLPLTSLVSIMLDYLRVERNMLTYSIVRILEVFLPIVLAMVFLLYGYGLTHVVASFVIVEAALLVLTAFKVSKYLDLVSPKIAQRDHMTFSGDLTLASIAAQILNGGDRYVLGFFIGATAVGVYSVAYNLGNIVLALVMPIHIAILPVISKEFEEENHDKVQVYLRYSVRYFLLFAIPAVVGLTILAPSLIHSLTTSEFITTPLITGIVAVSCLFYGIAVITCKVMLLQKRTKLNAFNLFVAATLNIALNIVLVPIWGLFGAAMATFITYLLVFVLTMYATSSYIKDVFDWAVITKSIIASVPMGIVLFFLSPKGWIPITLSVVICAGLYFGIVLFVMKAFNKNEMTFIKNLLPWTTQVN